MSPEQIKLLFKVLDIIALGAQLAPQLKAQYDKSKAKLEQIVSENRDPTQAEWDEINSDIDALRDELHS